MRVFPTVRGALRPLLLLSAALLLACSTPDPMSSVAPVQSPNDRFDYRLVTLDNGLEALLISNPDTPKAAASLDVMVGSGDNPPGRGGLAHFLEHMLFLGTEKYPDSAEYARFLAEHGGARNAYTSFEHTNYFFDVDPSYLPGALDRFAQFFIAPNFDAGYVERERNAVQAEYQMGLTSDSRRELDVLQAVMNPRHPYSQFSVGSLESLADRENSAVRDELIAFYRKHYSANVMRLAVLGKESLDELESLVREQFAAVPNREVEPEPIAEPLFIDAQLPMLVKIKPQGTLRQLELNFQVPDYRDDYRAKPLAYLANLVGHEGEGSLLSQLKRDSLADGLSAYSGLSWRGGGLFSVSISLTEKGVDRYESVLQQVFAYLDMLREEGPVERLYEEQAALAELSFRFREPSAPIGYVSRLSNAMHYYEDEDLLRGPYRMERFDPRLIREALAQIRPSRAQVTLTAPDVSTSSESPYYAVPYTQLGPETLMLSRWSSDAAFGFELPAPNPFIADDVELRALAADNPATPELRLDAPRKKIWFKQAEAFRVPKGAMYVSFRSPAVSATADQKALAGLYTRMVSDSLREYTYPALLAGLGFNFYNHGQGISLRVSGYNDKQLMLLESLLQSIAMGSFDPQRFARIRREMVLDLQNTISRRPTSQLMGDVQRALVSGGYDEEELIAALERSDLDDLADFAMRFWQSVRAEALLYGNYAVEDVDQLAATLDTVLAEGAGDPALAPEVLKLSEEQRLILHSDIVHPDAVVAWYFQGPGQSWRDRALASLSASVISAPFFDQLRTEQQLGYVVQSFAWPQFTVPGVTLLVQSPSHSAPAVTAAMQAFLQAVIPDTDREQFLRHREALVNDILKPHDNLNERAEFYWQAIASREWGFDAPQQLADAVAGISFEAWQAGFRSLFLDSPRSLLAQSPGASGELVGDAEAPQVFDRPEALRRERPVYEIELSPL